MERNVHNEIQSLNIIDLAKKSENIYKTVVIIGIRAGQIAAKTKTELQRQLSDFHNTNDTLDEIVENREQIEIAKRYENLPKPTLLSIDEFLNNEIIFYDESE